MTGMGAGAPIQGRLGAVRPGRPLSRGRGSAFWATSYATILILVLGTGCTVVGTAPPAPPAPVAVDAPALEGEVRDAAAEGEVARLLAEGAQRLAEGDPGTARARAMEVESRFPTVRGSSRALLLRGRAGLAMGDHSEAVESAERYLGVVGPADPEAPRAQLLVAEARLEGGLGGGVEALFQLPVEAPSSVRDDALVRARRLASELEDPPLRDLVAEAPAHPWLLPVFQVELGARRTMVGDTQVGRELAERALVLEPATPERERARSVIDGDLTPTGAVTGSLGVLLSPSGPPTLQQLSQQLQEGVEVALLAADVRGGIRLLNEDDGGSAGQAANAYSRLEGGSPLGIVGPLTEPAMEEALRRRTRDLPMISPTAPLMGSEFRGAYSLAGPDPEAPRALARIALAQGIRDVVIFHPREQAEEREAAWFREVFEGGGGRVSRTLTYLPGTTSFDEPMREVVRVRPRGLVLFLPPDDVELVAPQIAYYGVDDLEDLTILGGASFSSEGVLGAVPTRHTDGLLTVAPHVGAGYGPLWVDFVEDYEEHFRRTLRSPVPGLGYDAARLLLEGARLGGGSAPEEVLLGLSRIQDFAGATGTFSVREGRIVRRYFPVRIENRMRIPLDF